MHFIWMLTMEQLLQQIIRSSLRPLCYFSWHVALHSVPQWIVVSKVSKENLRVYDWFPLPSASWLL